MALEHARLTNLRTGTWSEVLFNPTEYTLTQDNNFAQAPVPGLGSPLLQFVHGGLRTLRMELFFDTYEAHRHTGTRINPAHGDVRALTRPVVGLMDIDPTTHAPPPVLFTWGELAFRCVLAAVGQRFTMFLESGVPVRAQLDVTFHELVDPVTEAKEVKRQTSDYTRRHEATQCQTLADIAHQVYGDPRKWRPLALANHLLPSRGVPTGLTLTVPPLPYRDPDTGEVHS
ncbi:peptigoglycan-binding protein LysM [Streptomyces sp. NPDC004111]|uniref:CIS tube protein n=1 Tax=Streptomyces sp. NPDC004111 TaxID=3364690 RepID=UPI003685B0A4